MNPTPFHYLLTRADFELITAHEPERLQPSSQAGDGLPTWVEQRLHTLGPDGPVRLYFRNVADKDHHHRATIDRLAEWRDIRRIVPDRSRS